MIVELLGATLMLAGLFLGITAALGLFRLPDFYSRTHASGVSDTLSAALILFGMMLYAGFTLVCVKLFIILVLLWFTSPISSHSLVKAAYRTGIKPYLLTKEKSHRSAD